MDDETPMQVQKPIFKNEFNLTTIATIVGLIGVTGGWIWTASGTTHELKTNISDLDRRFTSYTTDHAQLHKDRNVALSTDMARADQRVVTLEQVGQSAARKMDQLEYRVTVQEQGSANLTRSVEELKNTVNGQSADIRVMLEILKRLDGPSKNGK